MRKVHNPVVPVALLAVLLAFSFGCSSRPSDQIIAKDIQSKVAADPETKDSSVAVAAKQGNVTLNGKVKTVAAQQKVEQIARLEPGVVSIEDQTSVQPDTVSAAAAPANAAPSTPPTPARKAAAASPAARTVPPAPVEKAAAPTPVEKAASTPPDNPAPAAPVERPKPQPIVVPAGTVVTVRVGTSLGSKTSQTGQTFPATLARSLSAQGNTAIPAGASTTGTVVEAKAKGKIKGEAVLNLALTSITVGGRTYPIETEVVQNTAKGKGKRTAATTGGGLAGGALIGGLAGGGKGAGIGALLGGGAGLIGGAMTGNQQIEIPAESAISFRLARPLTIRPPGE
jgi:hypothetical protein